MLIVAVSADSAQETNPRFFGGIFGDLFGNNNQCSNCRHNLQEASYCCRNAIDSYCCQFSNNLINGGGFDPGYNPGGSDSYKPGSCPSNYYGKFDFICFKKTYLRCTKTVAENWDSKVTSAGTWLELVSRELNHFGGIALFLRLGTRDTDRWQKNLCLCATCQCPWYPI